ncbi:hypothetical protein [Commensalibacter communis]|uniref:hypothetical protein n=1 Tax=Commensalibacter communis TaxID=2972786 RepID=UPI0022FF8836|nr:hypothetical protein [Commensalibacter communis]CAI3951164.1 unnamed protein product [Commensalibacter communis]CAI3956642.1 unnamed protein product [Commensalibacter communis]
MEEKIPQDILDQMTNIIEKMQEFICKYKDNTSVDDAVLLRKTIVSCRSLSKEIKRMAYKYGYTEISELGTNVTDIDSCSVSIDDIQTRFEVLKYINGLRGEISLIFDNKWKDRIRTYVVTIKSILDDANIENERLRNSIFSKLNAFSAELDKTRTSVQSFQGAFLEMSMVAGQSAENIKPAISLGLKVMRAFGHLIDIAEHPQLPPPDDHKLLPPPNETEEDQ